jgi:hypothetical protein
MADDLTPDQLDALGLPKPKPAPAPAPAPGLSPDQFSALGIKPGASWSGPMAPIQLPVTPAGTPGPYPEARAYLNTIPASSPDKAGLMDWLKRGTNGDPAADTFLKGMDFSGAWKQPTGIVPTGTSSPGPGPGMFDFSREQGGINSAIQGGADFIGNELHQFSNLVKTPDSQLPTTFGMNWGPSSKELQTNAFARERQEIEQQFPTDPTSVYQQSIRATVGAGLGVAQYLTPPTAAMAAGLQGNSTAQDLMDQGTGTGKAYTLGGAQAAANFVLPAVAGKLTSLPVLQGAVVGGGLSATDAGIQAVAGNTQGAKEAYDSIPAGIVGGAAIAHGLHSFATNHFPLTNTGRNLDAAADRMNAFQQQRAAAAAPPVEPAVVPTPEVAPQVVTPAVKPAEVVAHATELAKTGALTEQGPVPQDVVNKPVNIVRGQNIPYAAAASEDGNTSYFDKSFPDQILHQLSPDTADKYDPAPFTALHERTEQYLMNDMGLQYKDAHAIATLYEHEALTQAGHSPQAYEAGLAPYLDEAGHRGSPPSPPDTFVGPYVDQRETNLLGDTTNGPKPAVKGEPAPATNELLPPVSVVDNRGKYVPPKPVVAPPPPSANAPAVSKGEVGKPLAYGELKAKKQEAATFGTETKPVQLPTTFQPAKARVFKGGAPVGVLSMEAPDTGGIHIMVHPSGKAMLGRMTDAKGRPVTEGGTLRPVDKRGHPVTIEDPANHHAMMFNSAEEATRYAGRHFTSVAPEPVTGERVEGAVKPLLKGATDLSDEALKARVAKHRAEFTTLVNKREDTLTPVEQERAGKLAGLIDQAHTELAARTPEPAPEPAPVSVPTPTTAEDSPLTPAGRKELAEDLSDKSMSPRNTAMFVGNHLDNALGRKATVPEIRAALNDLGSKGLITKEQQAAPIESSHRVNSLVDPLSVTLAAGAAKLAGSGINMARDTLRYAQDDLPDIGHAIDQRAAPENPGNFGAGTNKIAGFLSRVAFRGSTGPRLKRALGKIKMFTMARTVAALHPEFAPIYDRTTKATDSKKQILHQLSGSVQDLSKLPMRSKDRVNKALIQFQLNQTKAADYDKPFTFTDLSGRQTTHVLTSGEINVVNAIYDSTHAALTDHVNALKYALDIPRAFTGSDIRREMAKNRLPGSASAILPIIDTLEAAEDSGVGYAPFTRFSGYKNAAVWKRAEFDNANSSIERDAAQVAFITSEGASDYESQIKALRQKYPEEDFRIHEWADGNNKQGVNTKFISAAQLQTLADAAGVDPKVFQAFINDGVGDLLASQGIRSHFKTRSLVDGMSTDMPRVVAGYLNRMTAASENLRANKDIGRLMKNMQDPELAKYAQEFNMRANAESPQVASTLKQIMVTAYLGLNVRSALSYTAQATYYGPRNMFMFTKNPAIAVGHFLEGLRGVGQALAHALGAPQLWNYARGQAHMDQAAWAIDRFRLSDPGLSHAIRNQDEKGLFLSSNERIIRELSHGQNPSWLQKSGLQAMRLFSHVDSANRLSIFIGGYKTWQSISKSDPGFVRAMRNQGFTGNSPEEFGKWFSEFHNGRFDQSEPSKLFQGAVTESNTGDKNFAPSSVQHMAGALRSWDMNALQGSALQLRAAYKGGWIDKLRYAAAIATTVGLLGTAGTIVGLNVEDAIEHALHSGLTTQERIEQTNVGHAALHGETGKMVARAFGQKSGEYTDELSSNLGAGKVIPVDSLADLITPIGYIEHLAEEGVRLAHSQSGWDKAEALAGMVGSGPQRLERIARMQATRDGYVSNGKTLVPDVSTAAKGALAIGGGDQLMYGLGFTPPAVNETRKNLAEKYELKMSSSDFIEYISNALASNYFSTKSKADKATTQHELEEEIRARDTQAHMSGALENMVSIDEIKHAYQQAKLRHKFGATPSLKSVGKQQRPELRRIEKANVEPGSDLVK